MARESVGGPGTAAVLSLPTTHWKRLPEVRWPGRPQTMIDQVLVGPSGVYVVSYLSSGCGPEMGVGRLELGLILGVEASASSEAATAVGALLPSRYQARVRPVLCSRGDEERAEYVRGVLVTSSMTLEHILRSSPVVLSTSEVAEVSARLQALLEPFPMAVAPLPSRWARGRRWAAYAATSAAAFGAVAFGPELTEVVRIW